MPLYQFSPPDGSLPSSSYSRSNQRQTFQRQQVSFVPTYVPNLAPTQPLPMFYQPPPDPSLPMTETHKPSTLGTLAPKSMAFLSDKNNYPDQWNWKNFLLLGFAPTWMPWAANRASSIDMSKVAGAGAAGGAKAAPGGPAAMAPAAASAGAVEFGRQFIFGSQDVNISQRDIQTNAINNAPVQLSNAYMYYNQQNIAQRPYNPNQLQPPHRQLLLQ